MRRPFTTCVPMLLVVALTRRRSLLRRLRQRRTPAGEPKLAFSAPAGLLLIQIKPDSTAVFEELLGKLRAGMEKSTDATLKEQFANFKVYKASEPMGAEKNALCGCRRPGRREGRVRVLSDPSEGHDAGRAARARDAGNVQEVLDRVRRAVRKLNLTPVK